MASAFLRAGGDDKDEDDEIYFFFTETAREYDFYEKVKVPRVARVCKVGPSLLGLHSSTLVPVAWASHAKLGSALLSLGGPGRTEDVAEEVDNLPEDTAGLL